MFAVPSLRSRFSCARRVRIRLASLESLHPLGSERSGAADGRLGGGRHGRRLYARRGLVQEAREKIVANKCKLDSTAQEVSSRVLECCVFAAAFRVRFSEAVRARRRRARLRMRSQRARQRAQLVSHTRRRPPGRGSSRSRRRRTSRPRRGSRARPGPHWMPPFRPRVPHRARDLVGHLQRHRAHGRTGQATAARAQPRPAAAGSRARPRRVLISERASAPPASAAAATAPDVDDVRRQLHDQRLGRQRPTRPIRARHLARVGAHHAAGLDVRAGDVQLERRDLGARGDRLHQARELVVREARHAHDQRHRQGREHRQVVRPGSPPGPCSAARSS